MTSIRPLNFEVIQKGWDESCRKVLGNTTTREVGKNVNLLAGRSCCADFDRDVFGLTFVSGQPYCRITPLAQLMHNSVRFVNIVSYLDRMISTLVVVVESFDIVNVFVARAICRHGRQLPSAEQMRSRTDEACKLRKRSASQY